MRACKRGYHKPLQKWEVGLDDATEMRDGLKSTFPVLGHHI